MTTPHSATLAELIDLWRRASASDRVAFLAHATTGTAPATGGYPAHEQNDGSSRVVFPGEVPPPAGDTSPTFQVVYVEPEAD